MTTRVRIRPVAAVKRAVSCRCSFLIMAASAFKAVPNPVHGLNLDTCANGLEAPSEEIDIVVKIAVLHLGVRPPYVRQYQPPG